MAPGSSSSAEGRGRVYFRRARLACWGTLLALLCVVLLINQAGLPGFITRPVVARLRARGIDFQFSRIHFSIVRGIVADQVRFATVGDARGGRISFDQVVVGLDLGALFHRQIQVDSLELRRGNLVWPLSETNIPHRTLVLEELRTDLRFLADDTWSLDHLQATFARVKLQLAGTVTNAAALADWEWFRPAPSTIPSTNPWPHRLGQVVDLVQRLECKQPPEVHLDLHGDAKRPEGFEVRLSVRVPDATLREGLLSDGKLVARMLPETRRHPARAEFELSGARLRTEWGTLRDFEIDLAGTLVGIPTNLPPGEASIQARSVQTRWASGDRLLAKGSFHPAKTAGSLLESTWQLTLAAARWTNGSARSIEAAGSSSFSPTNLTGATAAARIAATQVETEWGTGRRLTINLAVAPRPPPPHAGGGPPPGWYEAASAHAVEARWQFTEVRTHGLDLQQLDGEAKWSAPRLAVANLAARIGGREATLAGNWDVADGEIALSLRSGLDPGQLAPALPAEVRDWLKQATWDAPPVIEAQVAAHAPSFARGGSNGLSNLWPGLSAAGNAKLPAGLAIKGIKASSIETRFSLTNQSWTLHRLAIRRPEGELSGTCEIDARTGRFHSILTSRLDPKLCLPLLDPDVKEVFDWAVLSQPPLVEAELWGDFAHWDRIGANARVAITNFSFRGESATSLSTRLHYTNQWLECYSPLATFGARQMKADGLAADFRSLLLYLTNGWGNTDPMVLTHMIGPVTAAAIAPFQFKTPPTVRASGIIPLEDEKKADIHFHIEGGPFHWLYFDPAQISGDLHWRGLYLYLTGVNLDFFDGQASGGATVFFNPAKPGTDFAFSLTTTNTDLQKLTRAVFNPTNNLQGRLSGTLTITNADSENWRQTGGYGQANLRDGLIWDIPVFGIFSKPLDDLSPGIGTSRISAGKCSFIITNGVIRSDNLELRSPMVGLSYEGTTDLQGRVNARVRAGPLRSAPMVGPIVSSVFLPLSWFFEYKLTGDIGNPKTELLNPLAQMIFMPFHPFRTIKNLFFEDSPAARTNHPPSSLPQPSTPR